MIYVSSRKNPEVQPVATVAVVRGKRGFHPCSYEAFLKLKELKKWYFLTLSDLGRWVRWHRKTKYRIGPEPKYCKTFVVDKWEMRKFVDAEGNTQIRLYPKTRVDHGVCAAFKEARMPKATAEEVVALPLTEADIDGLHKEVSMYFKA
jgi:hypothetical protein